ncbi:MAG: selenide, water dikinase SelD [Elainellaceae cyanobacterium]
MMPIAQDLVLIGGGHSHAIALKQFGMHPMSGVRLTLITDVAHTPYSGMLPGYVAGLYDFDDCHIDLRPLSLFAGAQMVISQAAGLDLDNGRVLLADRPPIAFDLLSIDIGSTPTTLPIPGASDYAIPVKPISKFLRDWEQVVAQVAARPEQRVRMAIVGGGAGGVELTLAVQARLQQIYRAAQQPPTNLELHLFQRGDRLVPERSSWVSKKLEQMLRDRGVRLHLQQNVVAIEGSEQQGLNRRQQPTTLSATLKQVRCESGLTIACDYLFWVTQASAAPWLQESGLATDANGFIQVQDTLQSISHPTVFAAGDVATMINHPRPKAGVFAVRQGKPLYQNLRRVLQGISPRPFTPQQKFLILIGTGDRQAIASRGWLHMGPHSLIWQWKDRIDRQFMNKFSNLQPMSMEQNQGMKVQPSPASDRPPTPMPCAGCGSKVGSSVLERVLTRIQQEQPQPLRSDIVIGLDAPDDAAVVTVPTGQVMVQTIDHFRALLNDPFLFGQISTHHCLSDIFAMGASPQSAMAIATLPYATEPKLEETLYQLLSGAMNALNLSNTVLVGGHTTEGTELAFGLSCSGIADPAQLWRKQGMQPGQVLILTKAIGTGTLFAADMQLKARGRWIEAAIQSMLLSNQAAVDCLRQHQATACTDVTGFGLIGHLIEMIRASQVTVTLDINTLPILEGAKATTQQGIVSSLYSQNLRAVSYISNPQTAADHPLYPLLFDPQTSGGLLASVPEAQASACLEALRSLGYAESRAIGRVLNKATVPSLQLEGV